MAFATQRLGTITDLDDLGLPYEALASVSERRKERQLRAASGTILSYVRSRYRPPLLIELEESDLSGIDASQVAVAGAPEDALSLGLRVDSTGTVGVDTIAIAWSFDNGETYPYTGFLAPSGAFTEVSGFVVTLSGLVTAGAEIKLLAGCDWSVRTAVVAVAAYNLVYNRGVDPESPDGQALRTRYEDAIAWAKDIQKQTAKIAESSDSTPSKVETGVRTGGSSNSWDWLDC